MMMKHSALLLLLVALLPSFQAISPSHRISDILGRGILQSKRSRGVGGDVELDDTSGSDDVEILYFNQRLDHFSNDAMTTTSTATTTTTSSYFKQRFFYSPRYATFSGGGGGGDGGGPRGNRGKKHAAAPLAFLCVGGEGPDMDSSVLIDSVHCTGDMIGLAEKLHVEHGREVHLFALGEYP